MRDTNVTCTVPMSIVSVRPVHVSAPAIDDLCAAMHIAGRTELVHYAGASYRDLVAWHMCIEWVADPSASEATLLVRARRYAGG